MTKETRKRIFNKYGGRCAYCGCVLGDNWHIDHVEPLQRGKGDKYKHRDVESNMVPSCPSCNNYKSTLSLEKFRGELMLLPDRLSNRVNIYKIAKRYGIVRVVPKSYQIVFYFEDYNNLMYKKEE
jgi:hypothetical protein